MTPAAPARPLAVLLDLDGTLVDTVPFILAAVRHTFEGYGSAPTDAEWIAGIGTPLREQLAGLARRPEDVDGLYRRYREFWLAHHDDMTRCFPGALDVVAALHSAGHPVGIVTAKIEEGARRTLRHVGLLPHVDAIVAADTCARSKPDPLPVQVALERLGRAPAEALFVGDSPHDVAAGNAAGVATAAVLWGACDRATLARAAPRHWLEQVGDLPALVAALDGSRPA